MNYILNIFNNFINWEMNCFSPILHFLLDTPHGVDVILIAVLLFIFTLYFFPSVSILLLGKRNFLKIFIVNFLLGWFPVVWIILFIYAFLNKKYKEASA